MTPSEETTRTTITLPKDLLRRLKIEAAERGTSMNDVVCRALEEHMRGEEQAAPRRKPRRLGMFASFDSGTSDTARRSADERPEPRSWR